MLVYAVSVLCPAENGKIASPGKTIGSVKNTKLSVASAYVLISVGLALIVFIFKNNAVNKNIVIYLTLIVLAGTLAIFGANVVFEAVDLLLFVCCGINLVALTIFAYKTNKELKDNKAGKTQKAA